MDKAAQQARPAIAVLSPNYLSASFPRPEWGSVFAGDPPGAERKLVPVRVAIDLVGLDEARARERLLDGMRERLRTDGIQLIHRADHIEDRRDLLPIALTHRLATRVVLRLRRPKRPRLGTRAMPTERGSN